MKILFLTRSLATGGAERQLVALARGLSERGHDVIIAQFYSGGQLERELDNSFVRIVNLNKQGRWSNFAFFTRLYNLVRLGKPDIIHGYLGIPNIFSYLLSKFFPNLKVVWGVRASDMDLSRYDRVARLSYWIECKLSCWADLIIANSEAGRQHAIKNGFSSSKMRVIHNGIDTIQFYPNRASGLQVRDEWGVDPSAVLVGIIARVDPMKDHETFLRAALRVRQQIPDCQFVCVGRCDATNSARLKELVSELGIDDAIIWAGERDDLPAVYNALTLLCQSSITEGFPNVIAEAMACGVPCVGTNVGETAFIIGETGRVVPSRDPEKLADTMLEMLRCKQVLPCSTARERIEKLFSFSHLIDASEYELLSIVTKDKN